MIPFDLSRLDGSKKDHTHLRTINRVMEIGKLYLGESDKSRDAAVLLCAKYVCLSLYMYVCLYLCMYVCLSVCLVCLKQSLVMSDVLFSFRLLSRPDVQKLKLEEFLEWVQTILLTTDGNNIT